MASVTEQDLSKAVKTGDYQRVYCLYGRDVLTIENYARRLAKKLVRPDAVDYNLHRFSGAARDFNLERFAEVTEQLPVFAERVCVLVNDLNAEEFKADILAKIIEILIGLPETTTVILYATGVDLCGGKKFPTPKNKKLIDAVSKAGTSCHFPLKTARELGKVAGWMAERAGCSIQRVDGEYLAELCLNDSLLFTQEMHKLTAYALAVQTDSPAPITRGMIDRLAVRQLDSGAFDIARAVLQGRQGRALGLLSDVFAQRVEAAAVSAALCMCFADFYRARTAKDSGRMPGEAAADFGYGKRTFAMENAFRDVQRVSVGRLRYCMRQMAWADQGIKSLKTDGKLLLEQALTAMSIYREGT